MRLRTGRSRRAGWAGARPDMAEDSVGCPGGASSCSGEAGVRFHPSGMKRPAPTGAKLPVMRWRKSLEPVPTVLEVSSAPDYSEPLCAWRVWEVEALYGG